MSEELVIRHCAPTLAGMKTGSMFSCMFETKDEMRDTIRRLNRIFSKRGIRTLPLRNKDNRFLIYVFRPEDLKRDLENGQVCDLLEKRGYCCKTPQKCIAQLIKRINESPDFPHEVGCFLGCPPEDVCGFINNEARDCKCVGYWKVYGDEEKARKLFDRYRKCTKVYCECFEKGYSLEKLTVVKKSAN